MLIYGNVIADRIRERVKERVTALSTKPHLTVLLVGSYGPSQTYVGMKKRACEEVGIRSTLLQLPETVTETALLAEIDRLNRDPDVHGILVQLPLPSQIDAWKVLTALDPHKDVDGLHPLNMGKLLTGQSGGFIPCTPLGIALLLAESGITVEGKHVVIIGRSNIVGKPLAALLVQKRPHANATVTLAHRETRDLSALTRSADVVVAAVGIPGFVRADMLCEGAVVVDVGINRVDDPAISKGYRLVGDVAFDECLPKCSAITPVPKGVGPMTVAVLLQNTLHTLQK